MQNEDHGSLLLLTCSPGPHGRQALYLVEGLAAKGGGLGGLEEGRGREGVTPEGREMEGGLGGLEEVGGP